MIDMSELNENQKLAVECKESSVLVLAGPGSGKTRVLTKRVAKIIDESPDDNFRILCLTFTDKAAKEMKIRLEAMLGNRLSRVLPSTFHAFCTNVLRQHGSHVGLRPDFAILPTDGDRESLLSEAILDLKNDGIEISKDEIRLLPIIDKLFCEFVPDNKVIERIKDQDLAQRVARLFLAYKKHLKTSNSCDFSSLIYFTLELFALKPSVLKNIRIVYSHICVDEFQDTNYSQYLILKSVAAPKISNLFVVADDDQIIYQWNGASPERLRSLQSDYEMTVIQLPANYRCPPDVIVLANKLIQYNIDRNPSKQPLLATKKTQVPSVRLLTFRDEEEEFRAIAAELSQLSIKVRTHCVILARTTKILEKTASVLEAAGVSAHLVIRKNEFESTPIQWLHAILRLANARSSREQLRRLCKSFFKIEGLDIRVDDVIAEASTREGDLLRSWIEIAMQRQELEETTRIFLQVTRETLVDRLDYEKFSEKSFDWFSWLESRFGSANVEAFSDFAEESKIWKDLVERLRSDYGDDLSLHVFIQGIDLVPKTPNVPDDAVPLMTIHGSKGMEFKRVFLIGLAEEILPSFQSLKNGENSREIQEERRNCFVAITRAEEMLTLSYSESYFGWKKRPSRFLTEMGLLQE